MRLTERRASAPGKAVLAGEYAVLHGAAAVAMAVDRRARVAMDLVAGADSELSMPGFVSGRFRFRHDDAGNLEWLECAPFTHAFALFESAWRLAGANIGSAVRVSLDTREFFDATAGHKLGLGSSAAVLVALCAVLQPGERVAQTALSAHRSFQGGTGSGVDIAAAVHGGVLEFRRGEPPAVQSRQWPAGLHIQLYWSGTAVSTPEKIRQLDRQLLDPAHAHSLATLQAAANELAAAWPTASAADLLKQFMTYNSALQAFDVDQGLGIFQAGHERMRVAAESAGLVYKPCGAGGGDTGMALGMDADSLAAFTEQAHELGFATLDAGIDPSGIRYNGK